MKQIEGRRGRSAKCPVDLIDKWFVQILACVNVKIPLVGDLENHALLFLPGNVVASRGR